MTYDEGLISGRRQGFPLASLRLGRRGKERHVRLVDDAKGAGAELVAEDECPGRVGRRLDNSGRRH